MNCKYLSEIVRFNVLNCQIPPEVVKPSAGFILFLHHPLPVFKLLARPNHRRGVLISVRFNGDISLAEISGFVGLTRVQTNFSNSQYFRREPLLALDSENIISVGLMEHRSLGQ